MNEVNEDLSKIVMPCGLSCYSCQGSPYGAIAKTSQELLYYLEGYCEYVEEKFPRDKDVVNTFMRALSFISKTHCNGCRNGSGCLCVYHENCLIPRCIEEKGLAYCYKCKAFPCEKVEHLPKLKQKWLRANNRILQIGLEQFINEEKVSQEYIGFKRSENTK